MLSSAALPDVCLVYSREQLGSCGAFSVEMLEEMGSLPQTFLVQDLIVDGSLNLIVGDSGIGKTPLLVQLGLAVASGLPFCGRPTVPGGVLYFDCESGQEGYKDIVRSMLEHLALPRPPPGFITYSPNWDERAGRPEEPVVALVQAIETLRPRLVIVDPLRVPWPRAEVKSEDTIAMINTQRRLSALYGTTWINIHHCRKPNQEIPEINRANLLTSPHEWLLEAAGSRALINQTDTRLGIARDDDIVIAGFTRITGAVAPFKLRRIHDEIDGRPIAYEPTGGFDALSSDHRAIAMHLPDTFTFIDVRREVMAHYHLSLIQARGKRTTDVINALTTSGLASSLGRGKGYKKTGK